MRTPGVDIFDSALAQEVRAEFNAALNAGSSVYVAAEKIVAQHAEIIHDPDSSPIIFYALAALQLEHGLIASKIRKRALTIINSGDGLERWRGASPEILDARKKVEQDLRARLIALG